MIICNWLAFWKWLSIFSRASKKKKIEKNKEVYKPKFKVTDQIVRRRNELKIVFINPRICHCDNEEKGIIIDRKKMKSTINVIEDFEYYKIVWIGKEKRINTNCCEYIDLFYESV